MSNGTVNNMIVIGYVGNDPQFKQTNLFSACNINIATSDKTKNGIETQWHKVVFYGKLAEIVNSYVKKGDKIYVSGKYQSRKWTDKNGTEQTSFEIIAKEMTLLGNSNKSDSSSDNNDQKELPDITF